MFQSLQPSKIICVGLNYVDHAEEVGLPIPEAPLLFAKWPSAICGDGDEIVIPEFCAEVDYEAEVGLVVGKAIRDASPEEAIACLGGITCVNDVSARDLQFADGQWTRSKSFDTFCPVGPRVLPIAEVPNLEAIRIRCLLNGELVQDSSTERMIFPIAEIVAYASRHIQLLPGDLICTGTPAGVGMSRSPKRFLRHDDELVVEVEGVGRLHNRVVAARSRA
jgi:5-carboxymethyl-2-hydroxymuconate isomerase